MIKRGQALPIPLKLGAVTAVAGAIVLMVGTMLHPLGANPGDPVAAFTEYAADGVVAQISSCPNRAINPAARRVFLRESGGPGAVPSGNHFSGLA